MESSNSAAKLKVVGVGGAGGNAINDMMQSDIISDVEFIAINTDRQVLERSLTQTRVLLGEGTGAWADPEKGKKSSKESE